jgi:hypothetical protein
MKYREIQFTKNPPKCVIVTNLVTLAGPGQTSRPGRGSAAAATARRQWIDRREKRDSQKTKEIDFS